jgi:hypothetical protein
MTMGTFDRGAEIVRLRDLFRKARDERARAMMDVNGEAMAESTKHIRALIREADTKHISLAELSS